ncbi:hypothetical protein PISMIDRAFT_205421 [Pisolithus microcarpus 441]|uniref:Uncharacterized protein n=1 Tax=Pisolithus microcarpus 441 TaxID=765257 RepID=A0A0C9ZDA9_9AGAM|nr:hypothetical protein PISMIDRAFT_205421 [Pisolithus microcarpus 441]
MSGHWQGDGFPTTLPTSSNSGRPTVHPIEEMTDGDQTHVLGHYLGRGLPVPSGHFPAGYYTFVRRDVGCWTTDRKLPAHYDGNIVMWIFVLVHSSKGD